MVSSSAILVVSRWLGTWGIVTAVPLVDEDGVIHGAVALFIGLDWLTRRYHYGNETDDTAFALLDSQGEIITGEVGALAGPLTTARRATS